MYVNIFYRINTGLCQMFSVIETTFNRIRSTIFYINLAYNRGCQLYSGMLNIYDNVSYVFFNVYQLCLIIQHVCISIDRSLHTTFSIIRDCYLFCSVIYKKYTGIFHNYLYFSSIIAKIVSDNYHLLIVTKQVYTNLFLMYLRKYWMEYDHLVHKFDT